MIDVALLKAQICSAFADIEFPGDWCLRGSSEGEEPFLLDREFAGKNDWRVLAPEFLDQAPSGYSSALSFFSDEAFRFYLPAYLIADIDGKLQQVEVVFHLAHGLTDRAKSELLNPKRYGRRTWFEYSAFRRNTFSEAQAAAIVAYLNLKRKTDECHREAIQEALANFWLARAGMQPKQ